MEQKKVYEVYYTAMKIMGYIILVIAALDMIDYVWGWALDWEMLKEIIRRLLMGGLALTIGYRVQKKRIEVIQWVGLIGVIGLRFL